MLWCLYRSAEGKINLNLAQSFYKRLGQVTGRSPALLLSCNVILAGDLTAAPPTAVSCVNARCQCLTARGRSKDVRSMRTIYWTETQEQTQWEVHPETDILCAIYVILDFTISMLVIKCDLLLGTSEFKLSSGDTAKMGLFSAYDLFFVLSQCCRLTPFSCVIRLIYCYANYGCCLSDQE